MYGSTEEWKRHLKEYHSEPCWECDSCNLDAKTAVWVQFKTQEAWIEHVQTSHSEELIKEISLETAASQSRTMVFSPATCPVCGNDEADAGIVEHIADHLQKFSLFSLPARSDDGENSEDASNPSNIQLSDVTEDDGADESGDLRQLKLTIVQLGKRLMAEIPYPSSLFKRVRSLVALVERIQQVSTRKEMLFQLNTVKVLMKALCNENAEKNSTNYRAYAKHLSTATTELHEYLPGAPLAIDTASYIENTQAFVSSLDARDEEYKAELHQARFAKGVPTRIQDWVETITQAETEDTEDEASDTEKLSKVGTNKPDNLVRRFSIPYPLPKTTDSCLGYVTKSHRLHQRSSGDRGGGTT